jgi:hypothetical protein
MADAEVFLQRAMAYASAQELKQVRLVFTDDELRSALRNARPGVFDKASWEYWHAALNAGPPPPRPKRPFLPDDWEPDDRFSKCVDRGGL